MTECEHGNLTGNCVLFILYLGRDIVHTYAV